jgi:dynein intermediate chain 3, axonemal
MQDATAAADDAAPVPPADLPGDAEAADEDHAPAESVAETAGDENVSAQSNGCAAEEGSGNPSAEQQPSDVQPDPPKQRKKMELMDVETARAVLAEPFDEAAEADRPIPDLYTRLEDGSKAPLPGVLSLFLTSTSLELLKCPELVGTTVPHGTSAKLSKDVILGDVQFRGAISDFYQFRQQISEADAETLVLRANATDVYGDGNNFELLLSSNALEVGKKVQRELQRRLLRDEKIARRRIAEKSLPMSARDIKVATPRLACFHCIQIHQQIMEICVRCYVC